MEGGRAHRPPSDPYRSNLVAALHRHAPADLHEAQCAACVHLFGRTNNESFGVSAHLEGPQQHFYWRAQLTSMDDADYIVPTDHVAYYWLRNTAGHERDAPYFPSFS